MDLKKLNDEYLKLKGKLDNINNRIKKANEEIETIESNKKAKEGDIKILEGELEQAKRSKDEALVKSKSEEIKKVELEIKGFNEKVEDIREDIKSYQDKLKGIQEQINDKLKELQENPELKKHIEEVMEKRYERRLKDEKKKLEVASNKKAKIEKLQEIVNKSPSVKNYLIGIMNSTLETDKLKKQIDDLKKADPIDTKKIADLTTQISQLEVKITKNKDLLMGIKGLDFKDEDLKELLDNGIVVNKNGKIDLAVTLNNRRAQLNRQVKKYTKSITEHEKALETLGRSTSEQTSSEPSQHQSPTRITRTEPAQDSNSEQSHETENSSEPAQEGSEQEEKPKWYQFVKRFKIWNEKRKQKALPEAEQPELTPENNPQPKNNFKNALKYDIVKDLYKQADKQAHKNARSKGKEEASFETPISQDQDGDER